MQGGPSVKLVLSRFFSAQILCARCAKIFFQIKKTFIACNLLHIFFVDYRMKFWDEQSKELRCWYFRICYLGFFLNPVASTAKFYCWRNFVFQDSILCCYPVIGDLNIQAPGRSTRMEVIEFASTKRKKYSDLADAGRGCVIMCQLAYVYLCC